MALTLYQSTDASAPTLNGTAGALITVLDAILVNGYGSKAAAGWTKPYSGTNKAAYRQGGGNQFYYRLQDDGNHEDGSAATASTKEAKLRGYESMTNVDTGSNLFPTTAQIALSIGPTIRKSTAADSTARSWIAIADNRTCYVFALTGDLGGIYYSFWMGEFFSMVLGDSYRAGVIVRDTENTSSYTAERFGNLAALGGALTGHYLARPYTGIGSSTSFAKHGDGVKGSASDLLGTVTFPNPEDGGVYLSPLWITEGTTIRGRMRGLWQPCHGVANFTDGQTFSGVGALAGKSFLVIKTVPQSSSSLGVLFLETSDTWESN